MSRRGPETPAGQRMAESVDFLEFMRGERPAMMARWQEHRRRRAAGHPDGSGEPPAS